MFGNTRGIACICFVSFLMITMRQLCNRLMSLVGLSTIGIDWDVRASDLYCAECNDYVHHPVVERVITGEHALAETLPSFRAHVPGCTFLLVLPTSFASLNSIAFVQLHRAGPVLHRSTAIKARA
jgi:hypothetical protein